MDYSECNESIETVFLIKEIHQVQYHKNITISYLILCESGNHKILKLYQRRKNEIIILKPKKKFGVFSIFISQFKSPIYYT
jgi:endo-alpha-1,4-polygalactosaminidase (GH114 family)